MTAIEQRTRMNGAHSRVWANENFRFQDQTDISSLERRADSLGAVSGTVNGEDMKSASRNTRPKRNLPQDRGNERFVNYDNALPLKHGRARQGQETTIGKDDLRSDNNATKQEQKTRRRRKKSSRHQGDKRDGHESSHDSNPSKPNGHSDSSPKRSRRKDGSAQKRRPSKPFHAVIIEEDASTAFSLYRAVPPLSSICKRGRIRPRDSSEDMLPGAQHSSHHVSSLANEQSTWARNDNTKPSESGENKQNAILQRYLPELEAINGEIGMTRPYRLGRRDLPPNQFEVILRRRAVRKRGTVMATTLPGGNTNAAVTSGLISKPIKEESSSADGASVASSKSPNSPSHSQLNPRDASTLSLPARRTFFPVAPQQHGRQPNYEDDSTISSVTSSWAATSVSQSNSFPTSQSYSTPHQYSKMSARPQTSTPVSSLPNPSISFSQSNPPLYTPASQEDIEGDTSLGMKLDLCFGKVFIQTITPLDDGRASPAQLCGLIHPGDILIAVNGKSLLDTGALLYHDKFTSVLKPLSDPDADGTYAREVRLRFIMGEGKSWLQKNKERKAKMQNEKEKRKEMDPAGDIFSLASFMAVDQHSGMPIFGHSWEEKDDKNETSSTTKTPEVTPLDKVKEVPEKEKIPDKKVVDVEETSGKKESLEEKEVIGTSSENDNVKQAGESMATPIHYFTRAPPPLQASIARQIAQERQYIRMKNTSQFFSLDNKSSVLLRPPTHEQHLDSETHPSDSQKQRLEYGAKAMAEAKKLVDIVESEEFGFDTADDEDPMEVASRYCGTASVRTGASRRRWHRSDSAPFNDAHSTAVSSDKVADSVDGRSIRSGESVDMCDHRLLVELAANNDRWKKQVLKRLERYVQDTESESKAIAGGLRIGVVNQLEEEDELPTGLDSLLFGGEVTNILGKKKQSLALPPGEMTSLFYDLIEHLENDFPDQIFMEDDFVSPSMNSPAKSVLESPSKMNANVAKAIEFLLKDALDIWLKSFKPLPWKQRRALWPQNQFGANADYSIVSSRIDDGMSLSMASGTSIARAAEDKRNLREMIEDMELDHETRKETCAIATFYFTHKFLPNRNNSPNKLTATYLSSDLEKEAASFIDSYGSYLDLHECLASAGAIHSKLLIEKLVRVARFDIHHKEALKRLHKAKVLLFYERSMLSALLELLPSIATRSFSNNFDFVSLLVSAYPDLRPWCVRDASNSGRSQGFYFNYLSSLLHPEEGNDSAKQDEKLVKEWCLMLSSPDEAYPALPESRTRSFYEIASRSEGSHFYYRDLPFLMDVSMKMSEFGLALDLAHEIVSHSQHRRSKQTMMEIVRKLRTISNLAIQGNEGELNKSLLSRVVAFLNIVEPCMKEHHCEFSIVSELTKLLDQCTTDDHSAPYATSSLDACITTISENASPTDFLQVLSTWEMSDLESSSVVGALHRSLIRGARKGIRSELSGSLLRIRRAREEGRRPNVENDSTVWNASADESVEAEEDAGAFIWPSILDGTLMIAK